MAARGGHRVNRTELAAVFGIALTTVDEWVRGGCPYIQKSGSGKGWVFDTADVARWREDRIADDASGGVAQDKEALQLRKLRAVTISEELDIAAAKRLVAPIEEIERAQARANAVIRQNVMAAVGKAKLLLVGETDEARFDKVLRGVLTDALNAAADAELDLDPDGDP